MKQINYTNYFIEKVDPPKNRINIYLKVDFVHRCFLFFKRVQSFFFTGNTFNFQWYNFYFFVNSIKGQALIQLFPQFFWKLLPSSNKIYENMNYLQTALKLETWNSGLSKSLNGEKYTIYMCIPFRICICYTFMVLRKTFWSNIWGKFYIPKCIKIDIACLYQSFIIFYISKTCILLLPSILWASYVSCSSMSFTCSLFKSLTTVSQSLSDILRRITGSTSLDTSSRGDDWN